MHIVMPVYDHRTRAYLVEMSNNMCILVFYVGRSSFQVYKYLGIIFDFIIIGEKNARRTRSWL